MGAHMVVDGRVNFPGLSIASPNLLSSEPCALECTKMKKEDHFWTDLSADELIQKHWIHSLPLPQDSLTKHSALCFQKRHCSGSMGVRPSLSAHDSVKSLHQNFWATLLYGKNDILFQLVHVHLGPRSSIGV
ncbi:unnamed protein product [Pipistrellus nathusii]|uniref:Uncharacterized protein n=1 Tax=Pipistrellus nathusii TaxID=59473 RepID=A0ABP0AEY6_PIPNA